MRIVIVEMINMILIIQMFMIMKKKLPKTYKLQFLSKYVLILGAMAL